MGGPPISTLTVSAFIANTKENNQAISAHSLINQSKKGPESTLIYETRNYVLRFYAFLIKEAQAEQGPIECPIQHILA